MRRLLSGNNVWTSAGKYLTVRQETGRITSWNVRSFIDNDDSPRLNRLRFCHPGVYAIVVIPFVYINYNEKILYYVKRRCFQIRKIMIFSALTIIVLIMGAYAALQFKYNSLEKGLKTYLITVEGYSEADIVSVRAKLGSMPKFPVYVTFSDDPDTTYIFTDRDASDWTQLDPKEPQRLKKDN